MTLNKRPICHTVSPASPPRTSCRLAGYPMRPITSPVALLAPPWQHNPWCPPPNTPHTPVALTAGAALAGQPLREIAGVAARPTGARVVRKVCAAYELPVAVVARGVARGAGAHVVQAPLRARTEFESAQVTCMSLTHCHERLLSARLIFLQLANWSCISTTNLLVQCPKVQAMNTSNARPGQIQKEVDQTIVYQPSRTKIPPVAWDS